MSARVDLEALGRIACEQALAIIRERFESGEAPERLHYHNSAHTRGVIDHARAIGTALGMPKRELLLTIIAAAFHDSVQDWEAVAEDGAVIRVRCSGANEVASAKEAMTCMSGLGTPFTPEEKGFVASAILATIPDWSDSYATIVQPLLVPGSPAVVRAVALADLAAPGVDPAAFVRDGAALFAEDNLDIMEDLAKAEAVGDITAEKQAAYRARYLAWLTTQPDYARGRRRHFDEVESAALDVPSRAALTALFSRYDESIAAAEQAVVRGVKADFVTLMRQIDPQAFPHEPEGAANPPPPLSA